MGIGFSVFGGVAAAGTDGPAELQPQVRRLLGVLLADRGRTVPLARIVDRLWAERPPASATKIVHISVGRLRAALEPGLARAADSAVVVTVPDGYLLRADAVDLDRYLEELERAERLADTDPDDAREAAARALALWTGPPWGAQADEAWLRPVVTALEERHRALEELWADLELRRAGHDRSIERLKDAAEREPLRERRWMQLMLGLYRAGRQADALREFERARAVLREEVGLEPSPELRQLELAILQQDPALRRDDDPVDETRPPTSFVGRDDDLAVVRRALERHRLVTIVGLGGIGKTRLVEELVRRTPARNTLRVSLSGLEEPARFEIHVATQLKLFVEEGDAVAKVLAAAIGARNVVLTIDAAETALDAVAALVLELLTSCGRLRIVVTSRIPLGLPIERLHHLGVLPPARAGAPIAGTDLELMIDRAGYDELSLGESMRRDLQRACAAAGGIPMLVELAARRFELGAPHANDPVVTAAGTDHDVVRAAIADSLESVDLPARELLRVGAVLPGGMSEVVASGLTGLDLQAARRALRQLAWLHLLEASAGRHSLRYRSLDPIREALTADFDAAEREEAVARAGVTVQAIVDRLHPDRAQPVRVASLDEIEEEHDNLRFLLADRLAAEPERALELAISASDFWALRAHGIEGRMWLRRVIDAAEPEGEQRWRAEFAMTRATRTLAEVAQRRDALEQTCAEARDGAAPAMLLGGLLMYLAIARGWQGDRAGASAALDEAQVINDAVGSSWSQAHLDHLRAFDLALGGDFVGARDGQREFARRMLEFDDPISAAMGWYLAATLGDMGGRTDVGDDIRAARELATATRDVSLLSQLLRVEASVLRRSADERSRELLAESAAELEASGGVRAAALARRDLGLFALADGDRTGAAEQLLRATGVLVRLHRAAAGPAVAGFAQLAAALGDDRAASALAASVPALARIDEPAASDDTARATALLEGITATPDAPVLDDAELLERCAAIAAAVGITVPA